MKRPKRLTLPRVTVLAMSRKELVAFATAVSDIRTLKLELSELVQALDGIVRRRSARPKVSTVPEPLGVPVASAVETEGPQS